jgi:hypothetical protein
MTVRKLVQLINCQLCNLLLLLKLKNHILETNSHFTPELLVCALGELTVSSLTYVARLLDCQHPNHVVSMKISFISLFFVLGLRFACVRLLLLLVNTSCFPHLSGISSTDSVSFISCSQGFLLKNLWSKPFLPFTKGFLSGCLQ